MVAIIGATLMQQDEWTAHMRAATAVFWLLSGSRLTTAEVARLTGLSWDGAKYMLVNMSIVVPIAEDDSGKWFWLRDKERSK